MRWSAPLSPVGLPQGECQEHVGRFCLYFEDEEDQKPPLPPPPSVVAARRGAVEALRRAFAAAPADADLAGRLVRYLVEDDRGDEAASAAGALSWALERGGAPDTVRAWADLLAGFSLHAAHRDSAALVAFRHGLEGLPPDRRRGMRDVEVLLKGAVRDRYRRLDAAGRAAFERRMWRVADPLWMEPGNPAQAEHLARRVWVRLLPEAPWVRGATSWGDDLAELTLRYGVPVSRERIAGTFRSNLELIERYDPAQASLVDPDAVPDRALDAAPPGAEDPLDPPRPRSGHPPGDLRKLVTMPAQVTRFPTGPGAMVRVDAALPLDATADSAAPGRVRTALLLADSASLDVFEQARGDVAVTDSIASFTLWVAAPAGRWAYSAEAVEEKTRLAGRSRAWVEVDGPDRRGSGRGRSGSGLRLSDPLVCLPFGAAGAPGDRTDPSLRGRASLVFAGTDTLGVYAEATGPVQRMDLSLERLDRPGLLRRALHAVFGGGGAASPRLAWTPTPPTRDGVTRVAVDLDLGGVDSGRYALRLEATGPGGTAETSRVIVVR